MSNGFLTQDQKAAWISDLRSGLFEQGIGQLYSVDDCGNELNCCLFVLVRAVAPEIAKDVMEPSNVNPDFDKWYEVIDELIGCQLQNDCVVWNDVLKLSFNEISDRLEAWFEREEAKI